VRCEPITTDIREIRLVREDRYPSLELEVLRRWPLNPVAPMSCGMTGGASDR
jgi:hypothetical protein